MVAAFDDVSKAAIAVETIPKQLTPTLVKLPALTAEGQLTLSSIQKLSKDASSLSNNLNTLTTSLQGPTGPVARLGDAADQVGSVADKFALQALPLTNDARTTMRAANRTLDKFSERPQSILFGSPAMTPGPGEAGFVAPAK